MQTTDEQTLADTARLAQEEAARTRWAAQNARVLAEKVREKEKKTIGELEEQKAEIKLQRAFAMPPPANAAAVAAYVDLALMDIESQIADHRSANANHWDADKPLVAANTESSQMVDGRIIAVNDLFVALSHGQNIEVHSVPDLQPAMKYNGKDPWRSPSDILTVGNLVDIRYRNGKAILANVSEMQQERQHEVAVGREFGRELRR